MMLSGARPKYGHWPLFQQLSRKPSEYKGVRLCTGLSDKVTSELRSK